MANDYKPLNNAATNLEELLMVQNSDGIYASKYNGKEPFEVLAAKTIFNNYADVQAAIAADVEGPASATDNALARFDGTTGKLIQNSNAILTDAGALSLASNLTVSGTGENAFAGGIRVTGSPTFTGAAGLELSYSSGSVLRSYNRNGSAYTGMLLDAASYTLQISGSTKVSIDSGGNINASGTGTHTFGSGGNTVTLSGGAVTATTSSASGVESGFSNTAVNTAAYSLFSIKTASGGGDPYLLFYNVGVDAWSMGMDVSDSNSWKLSRSTSVGSNDRLTITTAGNATLAGNLNVNGTASSFGGFANAGGAVYVRKDSGEIFRADAAGAGYRIVADQNGVDLGGATTTVGGNLTVNGTGTSSFAGNVTVTGTGASYSAVDTGSFVKIGNDQTGANLQLGSQSGAGAILQGAANGIGAFALVAQPYGGNVLIGGTIDSSNGNLQLKDTSNSSTKGIGFGADVSLYRYDAGRLAINHVGGIDAILFWCNSGTLRALGEADGSTNTFRIGSLSAGWSTAIVSGNNATAITLDSSQRCILNGTLRLNNAYTVGAPTATGYVVIEDSAGNTYKVLVGT